MNIEIGSLVNATLVKPAQTHSWWVTTTVMGRKQNIKILNKYILELNEKHSVASIICP